ncbi:fibronectin type III domain-containing protein [Salinispora arenicola]|uniref:fibronectin type III domain-containing protein n=1 Tax=Salinispora arenicola TaxID=168697 RepID=UPI000382875D|nr:tetratricopeptide repeat protein [Salinispora arenicola]
MSSPSPLAAVQHRALALRQAGDLAGARLLLTDTVESASPPYSPDHPEMLGAAHLLARLHREAGDPSSARRVLEEALAAGERCRPDADPLMLALAFELATLADELGNRHEARRNFRRLVTAGPDVLGTDHPAVREARAYLDDAGPSPADGPSMPGPVLPGYRAFGSITAPVADERLAEEPVRPGTSPAPDGSPDDNGHLVPHWPPVGSAPGSSEARQQGWPQGLGSPLGSIGAGPAPGASGPDPVPEPGPARCGDGRVAADAAPSDAAPSTDAHTDPASRPSPTGRGTATNGLPEGAPPHLGEPAPRPGSVRRPGPGPRPGPRPRPGPPPRLDPHATSAPRPELDPHATPAPHPEYDPTHGYAGGPSIVRPASETSSAYPGRRPERHGRNRTAVVALVAASVVAAAAVAGAGAVVLLRNTPTPPLVSSTPETSTAGPPSAAPPTDLRLRDDSTSITLTWTDPSGGTVPFVVAAGRAGQQLSPQDSVDPGRTSYTINGLSSRLDYCFTVLAVYSTDSFATSGQVCTDREG